jgi:hypothetical protein
MTSGAGSASAQELPSRSAKSVPSNLAGSITGIGSLPFTSACEATRAIAEYCPDLPFWPQLPRLSEKESVIGQGLDILMDLIEPRSDGYGYQVKDGRIDSVVETLHNSSGRLTSANAAGFAAFEEAMKSGAFRSALGVKGQIEGPITLASYLFHRGRAFLADTSLFAAVAFHISQIVCWQIERLKMFGQPVLIFIDEPALCLDTAISNGISQERRLNALAAIFEDLRARGAFGGLHCCAARPFARMCLARPDILSFDAHEGLEQFFADPHALHFLQKGGWVAYGIVPTSPRLSAVDPASLFSRWLMAASVAGEPQELAQRALITATCGLALLGPASVFESFDVARATGKLIRRLAGVEGSDTLSPKLCVAR